jgi:hypothetical protein
MAMRGDGQSQDHEQRTQPVFSPPRPSRPG